MAQLLNAGIHHFQSFFIVEEAIGLRRLCPPAVQQGYKVSADYSRPFLGVHDYTLAAYSVARSEHHRDSVKKLCVSLYQLVFELLHIPLFIAGVPFLIQTFQFPFLANELRLWEKMGIIRMVPMQMSKNYIVYIL